MLFRSWGVDRLWNSVVARVRMFCLRIGPLDFIWRPDDVIQVRNTPRHPRNESHGKSGLYLLSLDIRAVRRMSIPYILKSLMAPLNYSRRAKNLPLVKPRDVFDLIGGTSTAGVWN